ncbi:energy transducer TonB [Ferrimonas sp. YFM]|uniref:energy transducer TonB n=1 Tax=Ferrimonas sp. YFM TaxID=3028878 RepID=UPI0025744FCA|nr:energy transducer TonB [Ferrimonas sp. YFM]BDY04267.1 hypothetical protein F0521_13080 [Ferrimonas sp. YFM]
MTPNRYLVATAAALLLQGSLLAAMAQEPQPSVQSGQVTTAVSLSLATAVNAAPAQPEPQREEQPESKPKPEPKPKPKTKPQAKQKPKPELAPKPEPKPKTDTQADPKPEPETRAEAKPQPVKKPPTVAEQPVAARQGAKPLPELVTQPAFRTPPSPPRYPRIAQKRGQQGVALVEVWLNELGDQIKLELLESSGHSSLDRAALAAVKNWQFAPLTQGNQGQSSRVRIPVRFALN